MDKGHGILIVSVTILVLCLVGTASATNWSVDGSGGADFTRIQDAINNASAGDTILVYSGIYYENVVVDKSVTVRGIGYPVVDAGGRKSAITLTADGITLVGFNATNSGSSLWFDVGIKVTSNNNSITGNNVSNSTGGIRLDDSSNNTITGNNVSNNKYCGIYLYFSSNNTITGNNVSNNNVGGICLDDYSNNNTIIGNNICNNVGKGIRLYYSSNNNTITGNVFVTDGLFVYGAYQNIVEDNTVNGKPLVYLKDVSDYKVEDAGQVILVNCTNITVKNRDLSNTSVGVYLWKTKDCIISNNTVCNNRGGICLYDSSNNITIRGNTVCNNSYEGILIEFSCNNTITGNNVCNNSGSGIRLSSSSNSNTITGNVFVNDGLSVYSSYQNCVEDNTVNGKPLVYLKDVSDYKVEDAGQVILVNCNNITAENLVLSNTSGGITLWKTENSKMSNNTVCSNRGGISLSYSSNNTIAGNNVCNNSGSGIRLSSSSNNTVSGNNVCNNSGSGIRLSSSSNNNTITGNNVSNNNWYGIRLWDSSNKNTITGNNICSNNMGGIRLWDSSSKNTITGNNVCNNEEGIHLFYSSNNTITGNVFVNDGLSVKSSYQNTVEDNTINGKPLVYLEDVSDYEVEDAGQVILVNCSNISVEDLDLTNTSVSIALLNTENSKISNNTVCNNNWGISLYYSSNNNTITGNNVCNNNRGGISLYDSSNNNSIYRQQCKQQQRGRHQPLLIQQQ